MNVVRLSLFLLGITIVSSVPAADIDAVTSPTLSIYQTKPLRVGLITLSETPDTMAALDRTVEAVRKAFAPYPVEVMKHMQTERLEAEIRSGSIDLFIASSGFFWRMQQYGAISIATMISDLQPNPNRGVASAFLVPAPSQAETLADLKGLRLSASYPSAFMSFRTGLAEIADAGYDPERFFSRILFYGDTDNAAIARKLETGEADAAMVRACWLETQSPAVQSRFRVIHPKTGDGLLCAHSTRTYPNLMAAVTQGSAPGTAHLLSRTLLNMPVGPGGFHWGLATDMRPVDRLYRELKIENYAYLREPTLKRWIEEHRSWIAAALILLIGLVIHSWRVGYLVKKRTAELTLLITTYRESEERCERLGRRMEKMQKAAVVGQLSNMIAHELSQPLAAVRYYCDGLRELLKRPDPDRRMMLMSAEGMEKGLGRTHEIVARVRNYAKSEVKRESAVPVAETLERVTAAVSLSLREKTDFRSEAGPDLFVKADRLEFELLLHNLVKNAFEAAAQAALPSVRVTARREDGFVLIMLSNTGPALSEDAFSELSTPLITTKKNGHGLGIPIALAIAEASGGRLTFRQQMPGGLRAELRLVAAEAPSSESEQHD